MTTNICLAVKSLSQGTTTLHLNVKPLVVLTWTVWVCFTEECWRVSSRGWPASCWPAPPDLCKSSCGLLPARWCHPQNLKTNIWQVRDECVMCYVVVCSLNRRKDERSERAVKSVTLFTSDSSWEGVGELLHVFRLCLRLVLLSSEDDLHGTLRKKQITRTVKSKRNERGRERKKYKTEKHVCLYLGTHDSNLSWGPGVVHISSQMFGAHHVIRSSVSLGYTHHLFYPFHSLKEVLISKSKHSYKSKVHVSLRGCTKTMFKSWSYFFQSIQRQLYLHFI